MRNNICGDRHFVPILVILFALLFLLQALGYVSDSVVSIVWPILVGVGGIALLNQN